MCADTPFFFYTPLRYTLTSLPTPDFTEFTDGVENCFDKYNDFFLF